MRADIQAIIRACDIDQDCPFKGAYFGYFYYDPFLLLYKN